MDRVESLKELIRYSKFASLIIPTSLLTEDYGKYYVKEALDTLREESDLNVVVNHLKDDWSNVIISLND